MLHKSFTKIYKGPSGGLSLGFRMGVLLAKSIHSLQCTSIRDPQP